MGASLARLLDEHDGISRTAGTILLMLDEHHGRPNEAAAMLAELSEVIADHVAYEEQFIYPEITQAQNAELSAAGKMFAEELVALRGDWDDYLTAWPEQRILVEWPDFKVQTQEILPRMLDRVRRENECLYPLALRRGVLRLR
jgi:hypothetical protein